MNDLVVIGGGGHGRELLDVLRDLDAQHQTWRVLGVVDDDLADPDRLERLGVRHLGTIDWLAGRRYTYALGIGTSRTRRRIVERLGPTDAAAAPPIVHPRATVGSDCRLDVGVVVYQGTVITTNVTIGQHTHLNVGCSVQHDTVIGDFVQFSPGVLVNGDCTVGDDVFLGTGAIITRGCVVGAGARVGAGAVVLSDVPAGSTTVGIPARAIVSGRRAG